MYFRGKTLFKFKLAHNIYLKNVYYMIFTKFPGNSAKILVNKTKSSIHYQLFHLCQANLEFLQIYQYMWINSSLLQSYFSNFANIPINVINHLKIFTFTKGLGNYSYLPVNVINHLTFSLLPRQLVIM